MKIGELNQHCGNCKVLDLCGEPYDEVCLCCTDELKNMEEEVYIDKVNTIRKKAKRNWSNKSLLRIVKVLLKLENNL